MRNSLLFALLGAVYLAVDAHVFTYQDDEYGYGSGSSESFSPSFYVSKNPPNKWSQYGRSSYSTPAYPSYFVSRTLPRWPQRPHGNGPVYDYSPADSGENSFSRRSLYRHGRSKSKKGGGGWGWNGGWWYKWTKHGLISGRWGAPPPPGLAKEHYLYGNNGGGGGWGWGGQQGGHGHGGHHGGHGGHGHGPHGGGFGGGGGGYGGGGGWGWGGTSGREFFSVGHLHSKKGHGGGGGYGGGGGWGWKTPKRNGWGWGW